MLALEVISAFLVAVAMSLALAHALEFPGKLRLDERTYMAVQTIYYPGFTLGGIGEPLAAIATFILLLVGHDRGADFWLLLIAFAAIVAMQAIFLLITQPTNKHWLKNQPMGRAGAKFFAVDQTQPSSHPDDLNWIRLRNRWEYSHLARAVLSGIGFIALIIGIAM